jgi:hypothetical protein
MKNSRNGRNGSSTNDATWSFFELAFRTNPERLVFVLTRSGFTVIDLDHCRDPETGKIAPWAWKIIRFLNSYAEISVSGDGIHIIVSGKLPPGRRSIYVDHWLHGMRGKIETYDDGRYITMTGVVLEGYETIATDDGRLSAWHAETFPEKPTGNAAPATLTLDDQDLIERLRRDRDGKPARFLDGDLCGKPSHSEARAALAWRMCFYVDDPDQIARILRASSLWSEKDRDRDRDRKAAHDARQAVIEYTGPRYDPSPSQPSPTRLADPPPIVTAVAGDTCTAQLAAALARIDELEAGIAVRDETIARQAARLDQYSVTHTAIERVIASNQIEAGPKITAIALVMEEGDQQRRGKPAAAHGRHLPGAWIAKRAGSTVNTANRHLKKMTDLGLIERKVVSERTTEETVDHDGVIIPPGTTISRAYYPDQASALIAKFTSYQRPDDASKHGGKHEPRCKNHPDAPTITTAVTICSECEVELDRKVTVHQPIECKHQDDVYTPSVVTPRGDAKMVFALDDEPPDFWTHQLSRTTYPISAAGGAI